jgi:CheY-like chemotaxis protein
MARMCMIAESDPFIARLLQRFAEEGGLQAMQAQVGQDVLELVRQVRPLVLIMEPELPGKMRGWDVIRMLREDQETCATPVITCSWLSAGEVSALAGDVQGYLRKPELHYEDFVDTLQRAGIEVKAG